jgi:hypothetical protein
MKIKPFILQSLAVGGCHFLCSMLIVPLTLRAGNLLLSGNAKFVLLDMLYVLTRVLYYPVIGLAIYPRHWFPGPWIAIPIMVNSILWGLVAAGAVTVWRLMRNRRQNSNR